MRPANVHRIPRRSHPSDSGYHLDNPAVGNCRGQDLSPRRGSVGHWAGVPGVGTGGGGTGVGSRSKDSAGAGSSGETWQRELERPIRRAPPASVRRRGTGKPSGSERTGAALGTGVAGRAKAQEEYERFQQTHPKDLSAADRQRISALSTDIPALWESSSTSAADRREIIRQLVDKVVVHAQGKTEVVDVTIHWIGGYRSQHEIRRSVARYADLRDHDRLIARLKDLRDAGHTAEEIAQQLNAEGFHSPQRGHAFNAGTVRSMLSRQGLTRRPPGMLPSTRASTSRTSGGWRSWPWN